MAPNPVVAETSCAQGTRPTQDRSAPENEARSSSEFGIPDSELSRGAGPWDWRPAQRSWYAQFAALAQAWEPSSEIQLDAERLRTLLLTSATSGQRWLRHPCVSALTFPRAEYRLQRDFQLAVWAAVNGAECGDVTIPRRLWAWCPGGGVAVPAGTHDLTSLAADLAAQGSAGALALDPWARSINVSFIQLWKDEEIFGTEQQAALQGELRRFLRAQAAMGGCLTDCFEWVTSVTQVVIPLRQTSGERSESSSSPQLPGVVFLTLQTELQIIEALVHESAHQHLFLVEAEGPLIDPAHTATYGSPLRPDPRPLRGVLLAYHALAYIAACYTDALARGLASRPALEKAQRDTRVGMREAEETLMSSRRHLTDSGAAFVDHTAAVASYGL